MSQHSYLGPKGYTILKEDITPEQLEEIKNELTFKPNVPEGYGAQPEPFSIFSSSKSKIFLPKFYGIQKFGPPKKNKLGSGAPINVPFAGELRANQILPVNTCMQEFENIGGGILCLGCGWGKCLGIDTPVMMYDGSIKPVQDIKVGEFLMGDDSTPRRVLSTCRGREQLYKVVPKKGDSYIVNESHILSLKASITKSGYKKGEIVDISVTDYLKLPKTYHGRSGSLLGYRVPVEFPHKNVGFDPYMIGLWLGDGSSSDTKITTQNANIIKYMVDKCSEYNMYVRYSSKYDYRLSSIDRINPMMSELRKQDLLNNKHIPDDYKYNSRKVRLAVLAGLIDSDGSLSGNCFDIIQKNERLLDDIIYLARSLGFSAYKQKCKKSCMYKGEKREGTYYRTNIHGNGIEEIPTIVKRKQAIERKQIKDNLVTRIHLEKLEVGDYYGFEIDGNHRFLLGDFTVTHNTAMALYFAHKLGVKTLVVVNKDFLLKQWEERIEQFLPTARVGRIQQKKVDIKDKDIVIGMLQSISMRDYPTEVFKDFGYSVFDEVHGIPSRVFSKALRKIQTKYHLGLSATPNRADGLTKVTKLYIGPIIFKIDKRKAKKNPKGLQVITIKPKRLPLSKLYVEKNNRWGKADIPRMLSNIIKCPLRLGIQAATLLYLAIRDQRHILVLSDRIQYLKDLEERIVTEYEKVYRKSGKIDEVKLPIHIGYYIGGMKDEDRKRSESADIVLATYSMAKEAMDIPILDTLLMATPKSTIEQSVGRVMRKSEYPIDRPPLVIDYVDTLSCFTSQAQRRKSFYDQNHYPVQDIVYDDRNLQDFEPKLQKCLENLIPVCMGDDADHEEVDEDVNESDDGVSSDSDANTTSVVSKTSLIKDSKEIIDNFGDSLFN